MDAAEVLARVQAQFPELALDRAAVLGDGDPAAFELSAGDARYVFQVARSHHAAARLRGELALLAALRDRLPCALPEHRFVAAGLAGHAVLAGERIPARVAAPALGAQLAEVLLALWAVPIEIAWTAGLSAAPANLVREWAAAIDAYRSARPALAPELAARVDGLIAGASVPPPYIGPQVISHGALGRATVVLGEQLGIAGWSGVELADPARDLTGIALGFGSGVMSAASPHAALAARAAFIARCRGVGMVASHALPPAGKRWVLDQLLKI